MTRSCQRTVPFARPLALSAASCRRAVRCLVVAAAGVVVARSPAQAAPNLQTLSDSGGSYWLVNNGVITFKVYTSGSSAGKVTSIKYQNIEMVGTKGLYYDIQGSPNIYYGTSSTFQTPVVGSDYVILSMKNPAGVQAPINTTLYWIIRDNEPGFSTYQSYNHTAAMADWASTENRFAEFFNESVFNYSSITDNYWGYQAAGDASRNQGRFVTAETSDMRGVPSEYIKNYETKYDWRTTYLQSGGKVVGTVTGLFTAPNTSAATRTPVSSSQNFGVWDITNSRTIEGWNAGPTHPQSPWADGASFIVTPAASHQGGPTTVFTGDMNQSYGPHYTYFNTGADINALRGDANAVAGGTSALGAGLVPFYDSIASRLENYVPSSGRGSVSGTVRTFDGQSLDGATVVLSTFNPTQYAVDPIGQEYQRKASGYNYWLSPGKDGTFNFTDVRPGVYRVTLVKPGLYREGTFDNITVTAGGSTSVGRLTFAPDINGTGVFQIGRFDRRSSEFRDGQNFNNWFDTYDYDKQFPSGVNYTVNPANPFNDSGNWSQNWGLNMDNPGQDFWKVNFNLPSAPAANSVVTLTMSVAGQSFINSIGVQVGNNAYNYSAFDHTADNASIVFRSGDTSSRVLYRKLVLPTSQLVAGNNTLTFHIVGGEMQWDALRLDIQPPGTWNLSQWNGGTGNWTDNAQWGTQRYGYTATLKGTGGVQNSTSTTFTDGATAVAPVNNSSTTNYYDASVNGGTVTLNAPVSVQKLSLLGGTILAGAGTPTLTANDAVVLGGGTLSGTGRLTALTTTFVNFGNVVSGGFTVSSTGAVTFGDVGGLTVTGANSRWELPGATLAGGNSLTLLSGGTAVLGAAGLTVAAGGSVTSDAASTFSVSRLVSAGTLSLAGPVVFGAGGSLVNSGQGVVSGAVSGGGAVVNAGGLLQLSGSNSYSAGTTITGGTVLFASLGAVGGSGANVTVGSGGAAAFSPGVADPTFLARLSPASTGALALLPTDAGATLNFTSGPLAAFPAMAVGAAAGTTVTYGGALTPATATYRLGGGGGTLVIASALPAGASVLVGNTGSSGAVQLPHASAYTGPTTIRGGTLLVTALATGGTPSSLGASSNAASNLVLDGGTLSYVGLTGQSTDRAFTLGAGGGALDSSGAVPVFFTSGSAVAQSGPGNRTLVLSGSNTGSNLFALPLTDPAVGKTSLTKAGPGIWVLGAGTSTYSGDTTVLGGTLRLGSGVNIPSGPSAGNVVVAPGATIDLAGNEEVINALLDAPAGPAGWATPNGPGGGTVVNTSTTRVNFTLGTANVSGLFSGVLAGNLNLVKVGTGTQILSGDSTYVGTTLISGGTLQVGVGGTPSSNGPGDGGFTGKLGSGNIVNNAALVFNRGYYTTVSNVISGTGSVRQLANAQLVLSGLNTYTGPTIIGGGIANIGLGGSADYTGLAFSGDSSINVSVLAAGGVASSIGASSNAAANLVLDGGTLFYSPTSASSTDRLFTVTQNGGAIYTSGALTFSNTGALGMSGTGDRTLSLGGDSASASTLAPLISDPAAGGKTSLTKDRSATWIVTNPGNSYSGDTVLLMGTLRVGSATAIPSGPGKGNIVFGTSKDFQGVYNAVFDVNNNSISVNALTGGLTGSNYWQVTNSSATQRTLTLGNGDASGDFNGNVTGNLAVVKVGLGTQIFDGTNSYTGPTTISAGQLIFGPTATIGGSGRTITIAGGAVLGVPGSVVNQAFLDRLSTNAAAGTLALTSNETNPLSFTAATGNQPNLSLGAVGSVTMSGTITPFSTVYRLGGGGGQLTVSSNLTGAGNALTVTGSGGGGAVVLSGTNTFGGPTTVSGATLQFNSLQAIGAGTGTHITVSSSGTVAAGYAIDQSFLARITTDSSGVVALGAASGNNLSFASAGLANMSLGATASVTYSGLLTPAGTTYRLGGGGAQLTVSANNALTGASSLVVSGPGTVVLSGTNNFTGAVTINPGVVLQASLANGGTTSGIGASSNAPANLVIAGGTLRLAGSTDRSFTLTASSTIDAGGGTAGYGVGASTGSVVMPAGANLTLTLTGTTSGRSTFNLPLANPAGGTLSVIKSGSNKWTYTGGAKTYSGDTLVTGGTLETLASNNLSPNSNLILGAGSFLDIRDYPQTIKGLSGSGSVVANFTSGRTLTIGNGDGTGTYTGVISSPVAVTKIGNGTQYFGGNNNYSATTTISGGVLGVGTPTTPSTAGSLGTGPVVNNARLAFYRTDSSTFSNNVSGTGSIELASSGTVTLTGSLTHTGATLVTGSGSLVFQSPYRPAVAPSLSVTGAGGSATFTAAGLTGPFSGITVAAGGTVAVAPLNRTPSSLNVLVTQNLSIAPGGMLDLGNSDLILRNGAAGLSALRAHFATGRFTAAAAQPSSPAYAPYTTLAIFVNDGGNGLPYFTAYDGVAGLTASDVIVKYTYVGDTNLDGVLNGSDLGNMLEGLSRGAAGWNFGDIDNSGTVTLSDLAAFNAAFAWYNAQVSPVSLGGGSGELAAVGAVPEPGGLAALAVPGSLLLHRRRRTASRP